MTKYAILSDIHGNLEALEEVLRHADKQNVDQIWFLGDLVVYGPDPSACVKRLHEAVGADDWSKQVVLGNNDKAVIDGDEDLATAYYLQRKTNVDGQIQAHRAATAESQVWTRKELDDEAKGLLQQMRDGEGARSALTSALLVHASPCDPTGMDGNYLTAVRDAEEAFYEMANHWRKKYCFFGHTHLATVFEQYRDDRPYRNSRLIRANELADQTIMLGDNPLLINPGSVGQPRDGDPNAAYAILDEKAGIISFCRRPYEFGETRRKLQESSLSTSVKDILIKRLSDAR